MDLTLFLIAVIIIIAFYYFIKSLNELDPDNYSTDPSKWFYKDGRGPLPMKVHYDTNNFFAKLF